MTSCDNYCIQDRVLYCNSSLSDDDFAIKSKYHNSILSCFNPHLGFQDGNLRIMFYSILDVNSHGKLEEFFEVI